MPTSPTTNLPTTESRAPAFAEAAPTRAAPVQCGADALRLLFLALSHPLEAETVAFLLDRQGHGGVVTVVSGTTDPDSVLAVTECLARAAAGLPQTAALVLASVRPHGCVLPGDIDRWLDASGIAQDLGVQLVEWYVISSAGVQCPRDLLGEPERWALVSGKTGS